MLKIFLLKASAVFELHISQQSLVSLLWLKASECPDLIVNMLMHPVGDTPTAYSVVQGCFRHFQPVRFKCEQPEKMSN